MLLGTAVVSAGIVLTVYYGAPAVLSATVPISVPTFTFGGGMTFTGGTIAVGATATTTMTWTTVGSLTGAQILEGILATTLVYMSRESEKKVIDRLVKELEMSKAARRMLHDEITRQKYSEEVIREIAEMIKRLFPNK